MDEKSIKEDALEERSRGKQYKRKKTAKWCKGKVGKEHKYEIVIDHVYTNLSSFTGCGYGKWSSCFWICIHTWECSVDSTDSLRYTRAHEPIPKEACCR